jgi:oligoribonuclease NrnB/cAMP/cGMP phosphodiesterase (DHH superfamily)
MTNVLNITHASCLDGLTAAWLVKKVFPDCTTIAVPAGSPLPGLPEGEWDLILVTDTSFTLDEMNRLKATGAEVVLLDHHKTAWERLAGTEWGAYLSHNMSGALLTENWLADYYSSIVGDNGFPDGVSAVVSRISDHDLWEHKAYRARDFIASVMHYVPMDDLPAAFVILDQFAHALVDDQGHLLADGALIREVYQKGYDQAAARAVWGSFAGYRNVPVVNCDWTQSSDVGNILARLAHERNAGDPHAADFAVCWCVDIDEQGGAYIRVSLRSVTDSGQCLDFAQFHGGGGHIKACGCRFKPSYWFTMLGETTGEQWP